MAIRANELGLPAVIGAGEVLYRKWAAAQMLNIDCANRRVEVLR
jgi:phosphoenolpyruvate-protein kinase (PTS system EI component)